MTEEGQSETTAPLTAEEIAVMQGFATTWQKMGGRAVNAQLAGQCLGDTLDSHAALRDRLARAERMEGLASRFMSAVYLDKKEPSPSTHQLASEAFDALRDEWFVRLKSERETDDIAEIGKVGETIIAAPTDGAPRAGER